MVSGAAATKQSVTEVTEFKETEIGLIPNDWEYESLGTFAHLQAGYSFQSTNFRRSGIPIVRISNIQNGIIDLTSAVFHDEISISSNFVIHNGDALLAMSGATTGKVGVYRENFSSYQNQRVGKFVIVDEHKTSREFVIQVVKSDYFTDRLSVFIEQGAQPNVSSKQVESLNFAVPSCKKEQTKIAEALSDADAFIESLENLIAKKSQVKQGAMQELLSGKRRLDGFTDEWPKKSFGEIFYFLSTATNPRSDLREDEGAYYVHYGDIHTRFHNHLDFKSQQPSRIERSKCKNAALIKNGDWIMADASEDLAGVGKCIEIAGLSNGDQAVSGLHTFLLREKQPTFVQGFKGHLGNLKSLHGQYMRVMTGMKVFGVSKAALKNLILPIPSEPEQQQITAILNEMESEIQELENKAEKVRHYKQGMMQELLTGRIRLV
jgi:type I restriction enzyme, S subunit